MTTTTDPAAGLSTTQFAQLRDLLARYCGVYLDHTRRKVIEQALAQRLAQNNTGVESYLRQVSGVAGRAELQQLAELALNHETYFFRNPTQLAALRNRILPLLDRSRPAGQPLRIWSAGCATGDEAYSLAICALEAFGSPLTRPVQIWATDLSAPAIARAEQGRYSGRALGQLSPELLRRYFTAADGAYLVNPSVRQLVAFEQLNLLEPFPERASGVDIIFCQNVTIYFQLETCRALIERFYQALPADGRLFLGFSETLWQIHDRFRLEQIDGAFIYHKDPARVAASQRLRRPYSTPPQRPRHSWRPTVPTHPVAHPETDLLVAARQLLESGAGDKALAMVRRVSPESSSYPAALALVARIHADRGDLDTAVAEARRAIDIDPLVEEAYLLLGLIALRQQQEAQAIGQLERARYLNSRSPLILFHLAEAYRQAGRNADAQREYANVLRVLGAAGDDQLLDGVQIGWLRDACRRNI